MKRLISFTLVFVMLLGLTGCSNKIKYIDAGDVTKSTMLARADGSLQVATVEKFDKNYYNLSELNDFIGKQVVQYNDQVKTENIKVDKIDVRDIDGSKCAVVLLSYTSMKDYADFNKVMAAFFHGGVKEVTFEIPDQLINAKGGVLIDSDDIVKDKGFRILAVSEPLHVVVDGKVKFYSQNAKKIDSNEIEASGEGTTIIVYKP